MLAAMEALKSPPAAWQDEYAKDDDAGDNDAKESVETTTIPPKTLRPSSHSQSTQSVPKGNSQQLAKSLESEPKNSSAVGVKKQQPVATASREKDVKRPTGAVTGGDGRAMKLSNVFGVAQSSPAIRHSLDRADAGLVRVGLGALETGLSYKALRVSSHTTAMGVIELVLEKLELIDDPRRYSLFEVSSKKKGDSCDSVEFCALKFVVFF